MSETRGGEKRRKRFRWAYDLNIRAVVIENEDGRRHEFSVPEIQATLSSLKSEFGAAFFPLGNDVVRLSNGTAEPGLGRAILDQRPGDVSHAQGSSYLGVVLEECGYF